MKAKPHLIFVASTQYTHDFLPPPAPHCPTLYLSRGGEGLGKKWHRGGIQKILLNREGYQERGGHKRGEEIFEREKIALRK